MQLVLISGHLILYRIKSENALNAYHRKKVVNLLDAYICSGQFAVKALSAPSSVDDQTPRRYQDGLECDDKEADTLFIIWYLRL